MTMSRGLLIFLLFLLSLMPAMAQQPQASDVTNTEPLALLNAYMTNGVAPGYWPTAGAGLTLNISAGTAFCGGTVINYAGGTLTMTNATNNIYLNTASSCVPAVKTTAFTSSDIPLAIVVAAGSVITTITDVRTPFFQGNTSGAGNVHGLAFSMGDPNATSGLVATSAQTYYLTIPFACTINAYNLVIDAGTITVKFWKVATGTAIPTSANSINTSGVGISTGTAIHSTTLSDFTTTAVAANDIMAMNVTAVTTAKFVNGVLQCTE
jgi:hypothetical protein